MWFGMPRNFLVLSSGQGKLTILLHKDCSTTAVSVFERLPSGGPQEPQSIHLLTLQNLYLKNGSYTQVVRLSGAGIWPSGQSSGLAHRRSRFDPQQRHSLCLWMYTPSAMSILGMDMCAIQKFLVLFKLCFYDKSPKNVESGGYITLPLFNTIHYSHNIWFKKD
jgi:hypothetical protein